MMLHFIIFLCLPGFGVGNQDNYERIQFGLTEYLLNNFNLNWENSRENCGQIEDGFDLAVIEDESEGDILRGWINESRWIGAKYNTNAGEFQTIHGETLPYSDWAPNHPDGSASTECVFLAESSLMKWEDDSCTATKGAICKKRVATTTVLPDIPMVTWLHVKETGAEARERIDLHCDLTEVNNRGTINEVDWEIQDDNGDWNFYLRGFLGDDEWRHIHEDNTGQLYGLKVRCVVYEVRTENRRTIIARELESSGFFVGLQLVDRSGIRIEEGECTDVVVKQTIPFMCHNTEPDCSIEILVEAVNLKTVQCGGDLYEQQNIHLNVINACHNHFMMGTPYGVANSNEDIIENQEVAITVCGTRDARYDKLHTSEVQLSTRHYNDGGSEPWKNQILGNFEISVTDLDLYTIEGASCYSRNDPHMKNLDGQGYEMQMTGRYVFYRHLEESIEIQVEFAPCSRSSIARCNCGIAIRAWDSYFVINGCDSVERPPVYHQCRKHLKVIENGDGSFEVTVLDTQLKVTFSRQGGITGFIGVITLNPSSADVGNVEGLCGNFNADRSDDFQLQNQNVIDEVLKGNTQIKIPHDFGESWAVDPAEDLFDMSESCPTEFEKYSATDAHCSCILDPDLAGDSQDDEHLCERKSGIQDACAAIKNSLLYPTTQKCYTELSRAEKQQCGNTRRRRDIFSSARENHHVLKRALSTTTSPPDTANLTWSNGWSKATAENFCLETIMNASLTETCMNVTGFNVTTSAEECLADVLLTGATFFAETTITGMQTLCFNEVLKSLAAVDEENSTVAGSSTAASVQASFDVLPLAFLSVLCKDSCDLHGECDEGVCVCDPEWYGVDCDVHFSLTPSLESLEGCEDSSCLHIQVNGDNFTRAISNVSCELTITRKDENQQDVDITGQTVVGTYLVSTAVICPIPQFTPDYVTQIDVTVSNNGFNTSGNTESLITSPACINCTATPCIVVEGFCFIDGSCVEEGANNTADVCESCSTGLSQTAWTTLYCLTTTTLTTTSATIFSPTAELSTLHTTPFEVSTISTSTLQNQQADSTISTSTIQNQQTDSTISTSTLQNQQTDSTIPPSTLQNQQTDSTVSTSPQASPSSLEQSTMNKISGSSSSIQTFHQQSTRQGPESTQTSVSSPSPDASSMPSVSVGNSDSPSSTRSIVPVTSPLISSAPTSSMTTPTSQSDASSDASLSTEPETTSHQMSNLSSIKTDSSTTNMGLKTSTTLSNSTNTIKPRNDSSTSNVTVSVPDIDTSLTDKTSTSPTTPRSNTDSLVASKPMTTGVIIGVTIGVVVVILLTVIVIVLLIKHFHRPIAPSPRAIPPADNPYNREQMQDNHGFQEGTQDSQKPQAPNRPASGWSQFRAPPDFLILPNAKKTTP